jgi:hypothetical protein
VVVVPKSGASETPRSARSRRKGNERAERWWVGEGNVRDKGADALEGLLRRWLDDVAFGREVTDSDLEMLRRGERWRGEPNEWERMGTRCEWTREPSGKDGRPWEISLERSREPGSMGLDGNVRNTDRAV